MTALPAATDFTGATVTEGQFKTATTNQRSYLAGLLGTDGTIGTAQATLGVPLNDTIAKTGAYTVTASDRGKLFLCSGTWSLTLLAAATAGDGFCIGVRNTGTGTITLDGNLSETIDGNTTLAMTAGQSLLLVCTGAAWYTVGLSASGGAVDIASTDQSGTYTCSTMETTVYSQALTLAATSDVMVTASGRGYVGTSGDSWTVYVYLDTTLLGSMSGSVVGYDSFSKTWVAAGIASGSHTVYVKAKKTGSGTVSVGNGTVATLQVGT